MTIKFDPKKTQEFFDNQADSFSTGTAPRDEIFLDLILPKYKEQYGDSITALDFGCGGGALLVKMSKCGIKAKGIEKHENLCQLTKQRLKQTGYDQVEIIKGSIEELKQLPPSSFDFVILMGVFQYLPPEYYPPLLENIYTLLKPHGHLVGSFQNALFDLFTFNKYTIDFFREKFFKPLGPDKRFGDELIDDLRSLITCPDKPDYMSTAARDNIYVQTTNPLTVAEELKKFKFKLLQKYFYTFFFVPRLIEGKYKDKLKDLQDQFEIKRSTEWYGHFMANAFVVDCVKE